MQQGTGSKLGKESIKAVYCHIAYLTSMQSTSCKMLGWMKHKLELRLPEISISILKSRDITLQTEVCLAKAMVFPVVMYGCESWTIEKAKHQKLMLLNCGVGEDS